jgi:LacI family transcriptional regulator
MSVTLREVARKAKVSLGTVSNVLNHRQTVTPQVKARVEAAIEELGYKQSRRSYGLAQNAVPTLAFLLGNRELYDPFHSRILKGVSNYCESVGALVLFSHLYYAPNTAPEQIPLPGALSASGVADCVVLGGTNYSNLIEALTDRQMPYVLLANNLVCDQPRDPVDQVRFDDITAAHDATQYLIDMGHRDIWYVGDISYPWFNNRYIGYRLAMEEAELEPRGKTQGISDDRFLNGFSCMSSILKSGQPVTAVFASTDEVAYGCWECLQQMSIRVPDQVSLLGFDDQRGPYKGLGLSTVRVEAELIGQQLAKMAIDKIKADKPRAVPEVLMSTRLIKRGTCHPLSNSHS